MSPPKYIKRKGGTVLLHSGHQYYKNCKYENGKTLWRCSNFQKNKCKGSLTMENSSVVKKIPHQCPSDPVKNDVDLAMADLKENVIKSDKPIPQLFNETVGNLMDSGINLVTHVPEFPNVQHGLYTARNKNLGVNKIINKEPEKIEVPEKFNSFLLAEYQDKNRILVFCSQQMRSFIHNVTEIFFDATYQSCSPPFYQLLTVHGEFGSSAKTTKVLPMIYVLMSNKTQKSYEIVFRMIQNELQWNPSIVHCDFERAAMNACIKVFPGASIIGCYYHWTRCVWRKAKSLGKTKSAVERRIVALCARLPLIPYEAIDGAWTYIKKETKTNMKVFFQYFEKYWLNGSLCKYISVFGQRHRTNNAVESWNSKINRAINKSTVNILRLLNYLEKIDKEAITMRNKVGKKRKQADIIKDQVIQDIQMQFENNEIVLGHALEKLANIK